MRVDMCLHMCIVRIDGCKDMCIEVCMERPFLLDNMAVTLPPGCTQTLLYGCKCLGACHLGADLHTDICIDVFTVRKVMQWKCLGEWTLYRLACRRGCEMFADLRYKAVYFYCVQRHMYMHVSGYAGMHAEQCTDIAHQLWTVLYSYNIVIACTVTAPR